MARLSVDVLVNVKGSDKLTALGRNLSTFVTLPLIGAGVAAFNFASNADEAMSKASRVYGEAAASIIDSSDDMTDAFSQAQFLDIAGTWGSIFTNMGLTEQAAADLSVAWIDLAQDMGSFHNIDPTEALEAMQSAIAGEFEPLKQFGVMLNETTIKQKALESGLWDGIEPLDQLTKLQVINAELYAQQSKVLGDFDATADGAANKTRILAGNFADTAATLGNQLLPAGIAILSWVNDIVTAFGSLPEGVQTAILIFAGLVAAIGPAILIGSRLISMFGLLHTAVLHIPTAMGFVDLAFSKVGSAFKVLTALVIANPFIALAAAVIAIAALIILNWDAIVAFFKKVWKEITAGFTVLASALGKIWDTLTKVADKAWSGLVSVIKGAINIVIGVINGFIGFINGIQIHIPEIGVGPVHTPAFDWWGLNIAKIPYLAHGGIVDSATLAMLGERGPEAVIPLDRLNQIGNTYNIYLTVEGDLTAKTPEEVVEVLQRSARFAFDSRLAGN